MHASWNFLRSIKEVKRTAPVQMSHNSTASSWELRTECLNGETLMNTGITGQALVQIQIMPKRSESQN